MTFRETFYNVKGLLEDRLHDFGLESADASTMGWTTMLSIEQNTRVTIDVPLNLIYSDAFLITGTLETSTYSRLNGKTVKLKVGDTVVDTTTTNVNGEYSFTQTPVSTGTHSFQVIFEGTNIHAASESSIVTREVGKETSVINLDAQSTKHYGDNVILGGTLLTDDGEYIKNASIKYYVGNSLVDTLTTDNYGVFTAPTRTITELDILVVQFVYEGDSNYTSVSANQIVDVYQKDLRLTSNKNILSYADNESATITAQLIDDAPTPQELAISGYNIIFSIPTNYADISNIPTQYGSFVIFFKATQGTFNVVGDTTNYEKVTVTIPSNNASQFKLVWNNGAMRLYQDGLYLRNSVTGMVGVDTDAYEGGYANFENNNGITFSDICIGDSQATDNTGKATFTYNSQGIGDVTISANIEGSLLTKTYSIEDCWKYDTTEYKSTSSTASILDLNWTGMPSKYTLEWEQYLNNNGNGYLIIGTSDNNRVTMGNPDATKMGMWVNNGSSTAQRQTNSNTVYNQLVELIANVNNGTVSFDSLSSSNTSNIDLTKLWRLVIRNGTIKNIKIKPL